MKEIIQFLRELENNNNKEWFTTNKNRYKIVQQKVYDLCEQMIIEIGKFDEEIAKLSVKECTYRIYRDTRFSKDKDPYKTHFGIFLAPGGKKSMHAGYYLHIGTGNGNSYPAAHMLASGNYCYDPKAIKILREDISDGWDEFTSTVMDVADSRFWVDMEGALKKVPKPYTAEAPYADFMRLKSFCLVTNIDEDFMTSPNLVQRVADLFRTTKPFNDYVNRAVDYAREEDC